MGDHRASIKIEFSMHDVEDKIEFWINWSPDHTGCDRRVYQWVSDLADQAMMHWNEKNEELDQKRREREEAEKERSEYERLKAKFEPQ